MSAAVVEGDEGGTLGVPPDELERFDAFGIVAAEPSEAERRALLCVATDRPAMRRGETEPSWLDMATADLGRFGSGRAPLLLDHCHDFNSLVGVVERAWIEGDACFAVVRFGPTARCVEAWEMVKAGILTGCSIGFYGWTDGEPDDTGARRMAYWKPYEVSLTCMPADWRGRVRPGPVPRRVLTAQAELAAASAAGSPLSWRSWAERAAAGLDGVAAPDLKTRLRAAVEEELTRLAAEAAAPWLR